MWCQKHVPLSRRCPVSTGDPRAGCVLDTCGGGLWPPLPIPAWQVSPGLFLQLGGHLRTHPCPAHLQRYLKDCFSWYFCCVSMWILSRWVVSLETSGRHRDEAGLDAQGHTPHGPGPRAEGTPQHAFVGKPCLQTCEREGMGEGRPGGKLLVAERLPCYEPRAHTREPF